MPTFSPAPDGLPVVAVALPDVGVVLVLELLLPELQAAASMPIASSPTRSRLIAASVLFARVTAGPRPRSRRERIPRQRQTSRSADFQCTIGHELPDSAGGSLVLAAHRAVPSFGGRPPGDRHAGRFRPERRVVRAARDGCDAPAGHGAGDRAGDRCGPDRA